MNWFVVIIIVMFCGAFLWELFNANVLAALFYLLSGAINLVVLLMK